MHECEPASALLRRILAERRQQWESNELAKMVKKGKKPSDDKWKEKYPEPIKPDTKNLPELPEGWAWASLSQIAYIAGGMTKNSRTVPENGREVPYLRVANVQRGFLNLSEIKTIFADEPTIAELRLETGDVLFTEGGDRDKLGRGWIWQGEISECIHQNHIFRARPILDFESRFISWYGNTFGQTYFTDEGKQTTNLASINKTTLGALPVPIPPKDEQQVIVELALRLLESLSELNDVVETHMKQVPRLRQAILHTAFTGQLVSQDPNDEPASVLLERIRAERMPHGSTHSQTGRGRKSKKIST